MKRSITKELYDQRSHHPRWIALGLISFSAFILVMAFLLVMGSSPVAAQEQSNPDLDIFKSVTPGSATYGEFFTFTLLITNTTQSPIVGARLLDAFPSPLTIISVNSTGGEPYLVNANNAVEMDLAPFSAQEIRQITIVAQVNQNAALGTYSNQATAAVDQFTFQSNTVTYQIYSNVPTPTPGVPTGIVLTKTVSPSATGIGGIFTFQIRIDNGGSTTATSLTFEDTFPTVLDILTVTSSENEDVLTNTIAQINTMTPRVVTMALIEIRPGARRTITITARVNSNARVSGNYANFAILRTPSLVWQSNTVAYQILTDMVLPPTGGKEIDRGILSTFGMLLYAGLLLAGLGGLILFLSRQVKANEPRLAGRMVMGSASLLVVGMAITLAACTTQAIKPAAEPVSPPVAHAATPQIVAPAAPEVGGPVVAAPVSQPEPMVEEDALDFPVPTPPAAANAQDGSLDLTPVRRLVIPALDLDAPVRYIPFNGETWRVDTLETQIAWLGDTGWPGLGGNIGLAGHVSLNDGSDGPFRNLSRLKPGDLVKVYTSTKVYTFRVNDLSTVAGGDISVVAQTDDVQLTLITCADWDKQSQTYLSRFIVSSDLIDVQPASQANSN